MARTTKPLNDVQVRNAKPRDKLFNLYDGGGLIFLVKPTGVKGWRFKYRLNGKDKMMSFGIYPDVSLSMARERRSEARTMIAEGRDPLQLRIDIKQHRANVQENTFERVALEWQSKQVDLAETTKKLHTRRFDRDIFPTIGDMPITGIIPKMILDKVLRPMEARGVGEMTARVKSIISQVFRYGVACGYVERDPTRDLTGALKKVNRGHRASITEPAGLIPLLKAIDDYEGNLVVKTALQLLPLLFVRPGELRSMKWSDIDFDNAEWRFIASKTKKEMIVPLSTQSLAILRGLQPLTGDIELCFPSVRSVARPMSDNTLNASFRRMGFDKDTVTAHGFRATFRTIADEVLKQRVDLIEHQLGHTVKDANGTAYNRTRHLPERHKLMQLWADYLDGLKAGAKVIPIRKNNNI